MEQFGTDVYGNVVEERRGSFVFQVGDDTKARVPAVSALHRHQVVCETLMMSLPLFQHCAVGFNKLRNRTC